MSARAKDNGDAATHAEFVLNSRDERSAMSAPEVALLIAQAEQLKKKMRRRRLRLRQALRRHRRPRARTTRIARRRTVRRRARRASARAGPDDGAGSDSPLELSRRAPTRRFACLTPEQHRGERVSPPVRASALALVAVVRAVVWRDARPVG